MRCNFQIIIATLLYIYVKVNVNFKSIPFIDFGLFWFLTRQASILTSSISQFHSHILLTMETNLQHEDLLIKLRTKLNVEKIKLWEPPYLLPDNEISQSLQASLFVYINTCLFKSLPGFPFVMHNNKKIV